MKISIILLILVVFMISFDKKSYSWCEDEKEKIETLERNLQIEQTRLINCKVKTKVPEVLAEKCEKDIEELKKQYEKEIEKLKKEISESRNLLILLCLAIVAAFLIGIGIGSKTLKDSHKRREKNNE